jgi:hypothetical protein
MGEFNLFHGIPNFNPAGLISATGANIEPSLYNIVYNEAKEVIEAQVMESAKTLNIMLQENYIQALGAIKEYAELGIYESVMTLSLSDSKQIDVEWDSKGNAQAKFFDIKYLGDIRDMEDIQRAAYPTPGTNSGWRALRVRWLKNGDSRYFNTHQTRSSMMSSRGMFPIWYFIEYGNEMFSASPQNGAFYTITNMIKKDYPKEMTSCFARCLEIFKTILTTSLLQQDTEIVNVTSNNVSYSGVEWVSKTGKNVFAIAGSQQVSNNGQVFAKGFILDKAGNPLSKWSGWLPR